MASSSSVPPARSTIEVAVRVDVLPPAYIVRGVVTGALDLLNWVCEKIDKSGKYVLCCNKVKRSPWSGVMNHGGRRWGEERGGRGGGGRRGGGGGEEGREGGVYGGESWRQLHA